MDPKISPSFWSDPDLVNLPREEQPWARFTVLWMITNPDTNMAGIFRIAPRLYEFQTGLDAARLEDTLERLPRMFVRDGEAVLIRNYVRYQFGVGSRLLANKNMVTSILKALQRATQGLAKPFLRAYPELQPLYRAYQGLQVPANIDDFSPSDPSLPPPAIEALTKGLPSPQIRTVQYSTDQNKKGECEGEPLIPSEPEVLAFGQGPAGIPLEYCADYHHWRTNNRMWLNSRGELILWQKDLHERWTKARASWKPKNPAPPAGDLPSQLLSESDPAKRRALRQQHEK